MNQKKTGRLVTSALLVTLGLVLSIVCEMIPFLNLPFGGTITICSLLPLVVISWMYGLSWGLGAGFVYSILQLFTGFKTVSALFLPGSDSYQENIWIAFCIILLDYLLAYTAVGLGGLFRKWKRKTLSLVFGSIVALSVCYLFHVLSGYLFYGAWAEWFFTDTVFAETALAGQIMEHYSGNGLALIYSFVYNGCYMIPEIILTAIGAAAVSALPQVKRS